MDKYQTYLNAINSLPKAVDDYFSSDLSGNFVNIFLQKHTSITKSQAQELIVSAIADSFTFKDLDVVINDRKISSDFIGIIFGPIASLLAKDLISKALTKYGANLSAYKEYELKLEEIVASKQLQQVKEFVEEYRQSVDLKDEYNSAMDLFETSLLQVLSHSDEEPTNNLNAALVYLLTNKPDARVDLSKVITASQQLVSRGEILLEGKRLKGTVENWFRDFFKKEGGGRFDNLVLSRFIATSENASKITAEEREMLRKVLVLYRNIQYFPESMENVPFEDWHIVPMRKKEDVLDELNKPNIALPIREQVVARPQVINLKEQAATPVAAPAQGFSKPKLTPEQDRRMAELLALASNYAEGSLERRAVEEEIKKMNA